MYVAEPYSINHKFLIVKASLGFESFFHLFKVSRMFSFDFFERALMIRFSAGLLGMLGSFESSGFVAIVSFQDNDQLPLVDAL